MCFIYLRIWFIAAGLFVLSVMLCSIDVTICLFQLKPPCTIKRRLVVTMVHNSFKSGSSKMPDSELPSRQQTVCKCVNPDVIMMLQKDCLCWSTSHLIRSASNPIVSVKYDAPNGLFIFVVWFSKWTFLWYMYDRQVTRSDRLVTRLLYISYMF